MRVFATSAEGEAAAASDPPPVPLERGAAWPMGSASEPGGPAALAVGRDEVSAPVTPSAREEFRTARVRSRPVRLEPRRHLPPVT